METEDKTQISGGCRPENSASDTAGHPWSQEDRIRWMEWRVRELTIRDGKFVDERGRWLLEEKGAGGRKLTFGDEVADYAVWLLKERDDLSWHQIAYRFFPGASEAEIEKYESKVRRAHMRVERRHDGSKHFKAKPLSKSEKLQLSIVSGGLFSPDEIPLIGP